ncbi:MAG: putative two-component sensor histidine kinase protein [Pseudonocardiales bacterium]|nr:putative two-component sensor histidine kinase protein [Pseudonocardiales bacterium]
MRVGTQPFTCGSAGHVVQFYGSDDELVGSASDYLADGLCAGEVAVVVATAAHQAAFEAALSAKGVDVSAARTGGSYIVLDAETTMRRFLVSNWPDRGDFDATVGGLIRKATETGRPVRVYGEMVALLWDAGHVNAALELETLWNELASEVAFSLFCAYPTQSVAGDAHLDAFAEVCRLHSAVVGGRVTPDGDVTTARAFAPALDAPRAARHFVLETLQAWGDDPLLDDAALIVTELATNAVLHALSGFAVDVSSSPDTVRIAVHDASPTRPEPRDASVLAASGRGLGIVAALANKWDVEPRDTGKTVWAELHRRR